MPRHRPPAVSPDGPVARVAPRKVKVKEGASSLSLVLVVPRHPHGLEGQPSRLRVRVRMWTHFLLLGWLQDLGAIAMQGPEALFASKLVLAVLRQRGRIRPRRGNLPRLLLFAELLLMTLPVLGALPPGRQVGGTVLGAMGRRLRRPGRLDPAAPGWALCQLHRQLGPAGLRQADRCRIRKRPPLRLSLRRRSGFLLQER